MTFLPTAGTVYFVGAGPGAPDLITVRGRAIIEQADLVLYADSLVQASVAELARKPSARIVGSADLHLAQIIDLMAETAQAGGVVARVHTGDPALYGAIHEQMRLLDQRSIPYAVIPGVSAAFAAAARLGVELTVPEVTQTVIFSRVAGRTPVPERESLKSLAAHGASLALYLSVDQIEQVVAELLAGGVYTAQTPAAVVYRATWPDEQVITGTLADIAAAVRAGGFTKHALIMVGPALRPGDAAAQSRLYDATFAHGYRGTDAPVRPMHRPYTPIMIAVTRQGAALAERLARELGGTAVLPERFAQGAAERYSGPVAAEIGRRWDTQRPLVLIMSAGIAVRACAPLLDHKTSDPAVICMDEAGQSVIPLLGGHRAGANDLARRIAVITGGHAAVTTASDTQGLPALDLLGRAEGWQIAPDSALTPAMGCLVNGEPLGCYVDPALPAQRRQIAEWLRDCPDLTFVDQPAQLLEPGYHAALLVTHRALDDLWPMLQAKTVRYTLPLLVVGMGCRRGVPTEELYAALGETLADAGLDSTCIATLATVEQKADEPGIIALAEALGVPLEIVSAAQLATLDPAVFSPSAASVHLDLPGVAEPSAMFVAGGPLLVRKRAFTRCTVAVAVRAARRGEASAPDAYGQTPAILGSMLRPYQNTTSGHLTLVSLGPGDPQQMTLAAHAALREAEIVVGYQGYIDSIRGLLAPHQQVIASGMKTEMDRALQAIEQADAGRRVALVSSGDIGIYAMAGPVFEALRERGWDGRRPEVTVLPGISAFQAAAARLGAAISHDFSVISLSDLLTPWELITRRVAAAAAADMVVAFYNPRSRDRHWQLGVALEILRAQRPPTTPVAFVTNVARPDERMVVTTLAEADPSVADMFTVVLVGNRRSYLAGGHMVTPRGYEARARGREEAKTRGGEDVGTGESASAPHDYPLVLTNMAGVSAVVIGGGAVGERKAHGLLAAGMAVRLISPTATDQIQAWAAEGRVRWEQRAYMVGDLSGARLAYAASDQRRVNAQVAHEAAGLGVLCNVADMPSECTFHVPALHRTLGLTIAVSTGGAAPARAAAIRDAIARWLIASPPEKNDAR
ncbi:MAG: precorrin-4 C(11)-methyltransferase [Chloroflexales bacterium]